MSLHRRPAQASRILCRPLIAAAGVALFVSAGVTVALQSSATPAPATDEASLQAAFAVSGSTVQLRNNVQITDGTDLAVPSGGSITLDLNGYGLSISGVNPFLAGISVPPDASLTVEDTAGGGTLTATGGNQAAGIGGGEGGAGGSVTVTGGSVTATGGYFSAGIGGGEGGAGGSVTVTGGSVTATGGSSSGGESDAAGIGGGSAGAGGSVTVTGGSVTATGTGDGAGIGGGAHGTGGLVTVTGGSVTASDGDGLGAGIGGGGGTGGGGAVSVSGGSVTATSTGGGAGIGGGLLGPAGSVTLTGGSVAVNAFVPIGAGNGFPVPSLGSLSVGSGATLTIASGTLRVPSGTTVPNAGTIVGSVDLSQGGVITGNDYAFSLADGSGSSTSRNVYAPSVAAATQSLGTPAVPASQPVGSVFAGWVTSAAVGTTAAGFPVTDSTLLQPFFGQASTGPAPIPLTAQYGVPITDPTALQTAFTAGGVVVLGTDFTSPVLTGLVGPASGLVILDLNGHQVQSEVTVGAGVYVPPAASLVVEDLSAAANGTLTATSDSIGAGIGGGDGTTDSGNGASGPVIVTGGGVTANGSFYGSGIGGGDEGAGTVTVTGGTVTAHGGTGAGIGGGPGGSGTVMVTGGVVDASCGKEAAAIGGGNDQSGTVTVSGGSVTATACLWGAGIGGGSSGAGTVTVTGGSVIATGGTLAPGLGGGHGGSTSVTISSGSVNATGGVNGAGIGGGQGNDGGSVTVSGGSVTATGGNNAAGIGGGNGGGGGSVTISGGSVAAGGSTAVGAGSDGVGFGSLSVGSGATLTIASGSVLEIPDGITVQNDGSIVGDVQLDGAGQITDNAYALSLNANGGSVPSPSLTAYAASVKASGQMLPVPAAQTGLPASTFLGWYAGSKLVTNATDLPTLAGGNGPLTVTLEAHWSVTVTTVQDLTAAFGFDGETVVLGADFTNPVVTGLAVPYGGAVILDLNSHQLTSVGGQTIAAGIEVGNGSSLTIEDTSVQGDGTLTATANQGNSPSYEAAGIGGSASRGGSGGSVTVTGGSVIATGGLDSAGIGGSGGSSAGGSFTVTGGSVTATGGSGGAGIGGGYEGGAGSVTVTGGSVTGIGGTWAAGIGTGYGGIQGGPVTVTGGSVTATGDAGASGIGCGQAVPGFHPGSVTVSGGSVTATGGTYAAGIGGGNSGKGESVVISGGSVTAGGGSGAPTVIGAGAQSSGVGPTFGSLSIGSGGSLAVASGSSLAIPNGITVPNLGTITGSVVVGSGGSITDHDYALSFDANGGSGAPDPLTAYAGTVKASGQTLGSATGAGGSTFLGWFTASSAGSQVSDVTDLHALFGDGPVAATLYAQYGLGAQSIAFGALPPAALGSPDTDPGATASSGLAVSYDTSTTATVCSVVSGKVHLLAAGQCTVTASQTGGNGYAAAQSVSQTFTVNPVATKSDAVLQVSGSADRSSSQNLDGDQAVSGNVYVFAQVQANDREVLFSLDGRVFHDEATYPFDFNGTAVGNLATAFSTSSLTDGSHTITARVTTNAGAVLPLETATFTVANNAPVANQVLQISSAATRSPSQNLDGDTAVSGPMYVFASVPSNYREVVFMLDGSPFHTEASAPFDFNGTATATTAYAYPSTSLSNGTHTISVTILDASGASSSSLATFTVNNGGTVAPPPAMSPLRVSTSADRSNPVNLDGATLTGTVYIFDAPTSAAYSVVFSLDGKAFHTESTAPFDFNGSGPSNALPYSLSGLSKGKHTVTAATALVNGKTETVTGTFTVS